MDSLNSKSYEKHLENVEKWTILDERNLPQKKPFNQSSRLDERNLPQKKPFVGIQEREPASCGLVLCKAEPGSATDSEARFLKGIPSILRIPGESLVFY